ncbi:MAG: site-2 protease family protein [Chloroherpetonaceae bacterium]|nr:site-2 protease family protein [Chloroherpetonaceae bacterium]MDW8436799.1 site-2 protease family protein [Chloroherpetonaceae bacterium]
MGWSFRIAKVRGIDIKIHVTFFLILLLGALQWANNVPDSPLDGALFGVALMTLLFTCVTLHELGHSIAAQCFGIPVREIVLTPLGGIAMITRQPEKPLHELIIAVAGPAVNVLIAILLFLVTGATMHATILDARGSLGELFSRPSLEVMLLWLFAANISLAAFNMIPAFPLDGGRVLRAVLAMFMSFSSATTIAATIGQIAAIGLGVLGFINGNFILILIAVFIFFGAGQETAQAASRAALRARRVGDAYNRYALTLSIGDRVSRVVDYLLTSYQPDFAVMQGGEIIGIVTRRDVFNALATHSRDVYVTEIMRRDFPTVQASASLDEVASLMAERGERIVAVFNGADYLGLVSLEDLNEAFAVLAFLDKQQQLKAQQGVAPSS